MSDASTGTEGETHGEAHATDRQYVGVAAILAVLTALEVMVFYIPALKPVLVPLLLAMMVAKFALVVLFFMHLKFDDVIFSGLFSGPLLISVSVILAMLALFGRLVGG
jgi:cytochrome c oxidase subunit 4